MVGPTQQPHNFARVPVAVADPVVVTVAADLRGSDDAIALDGHERRQIDHPGADDVLAEGMLEVVEQGGRRYVASRYPLPRRGR